MNFFNIFIFLLNLSQVLCDKGNRKMFLLKIAGVSFLPLLIGAYLDLDYSLIAYK